MDSKTVTADHDASSDQSHKSPIVSYDDKQYKIVKEGAAEILELQRPENPKGFKCGESKSQSVFYNPIQQYNRDLSVLAIKAFGEDLAAVRKARHQRRIEQLAIGGRGKKRKRPHNEGISEGRDHGANDRTNEKQRSLENGNSMRTSGAVTVSTAQHESEVCVTKDTTGQEKEPDDNGQDAKDTAKDPSADLGNRNDNTACSARPPFRILDALSATGLRALRYAKEIPMVTSVTANDLSGPATAAIRLNVEHNKLTDKVIPNTSDAIEHMHYAASYRQRLKTIYEVIDLDPYGTAAPFLDAAVQAVIDGGMLCVTCTDAGVFASVGYLEKTYSQYGGLPLKGPHAHEGGLRLILHAIATSAARYGLAIEPLLSLSIDFYARVFVRVHRSAAEVKFLASKTMIVYSCDTGCGAWSTQHFARPNKKAAKNGDAFYTFTSTIAPSTNTHCEHCGYKMHQAGPMWGGPLHNQHFIQRILDMLPTLDRSIYGTIPRIEGMLTVALNEQLEDAPSAPSESAELSTSRPIPVTNPATRSLHPFFFLPSALARILHCVSPSDAAMRGALMHLGYRTTRSHTKAGSICTDAPWSVIWEIMREWIRQKSPVKEGAVKERTAGWGIMQKDRSKSRLNDAKGAFREVIGNQGLTSLADLRKDVEAALYRLSKADERKADDALPDTAENGGIEPLNGDHPAEDESMCDTTIGSSDNSKTENGRISQGELEPSTLKIVFDEKRGKEPQGKRLVRYQANPRPDWGPMNRARGGT